MNSFQTGSIPKRSLGAKISGSLFFCFFMGLGLFFVVLISREAIAGIRTWGWAKTSCEITRSEVREEQQRARGTGNYYFAVGYRYEFGGRSYDSGRYQLKRVAFADYGRAAQLVERYRPESTTVCYVNPSAPNEAVLKRGDLLMPMFVLFPLLFVAIGLIGIYSTWRPAMTKDQRPQPTSEQIVRPKGRVAGSFFFFIFLLVGSCAFYAFFVRPLLRIVSASHWPAVPCVVISSQVRSHNGSHGSTTYSVDILYSYEVNGREFKANRYDFMGGSSSGSSRKYAIVALHPPGSKTVCYVNPTDPTEAVLDRGFRPTMWIGLFPLIFVVLGLAGLAGMFRGTGIALSPIVTTSPAGRRMALRLSAAVPRPDPQTAASSSTLKPAASPWGKLFAAFIFGLFWNGIVSVFVVNIIRNWRSGPVEWFLAVFMIPFVLIGLGTLVAVVYFLLAIFNPRPRLTITPGAVPLGGTFRVEWQIDGRTDVLRRLRIRLEGREEATYQNGKNTATDKNVFAEIEILDETAAQAMQSGSNSVAVPAQYMHSFMGTHNRIVWLLRVQGEIAHWPDLNEEFPVTVLPRPSNQGFYLPDLNQQPLGSTA